MISNKIPTPPAIKVEKLLEIADGYQDLTTYDSSAKGIGYIADEEGLVIISTRNGFIRIACENIEPMIEELQNIKEDICRKRRENCIHTHSS